MFTIIARGVHKAVRLSLYVEYGWAHVSDLSGSMYRSGLDKQHSMKGEVLVEDYTRDWTGIALV